MAIVLQISVKQYNLMRAIGEKVVYRGAVESLICKAITCQSLIGHRLLEEVWNKGVPSIRLSENGRKVMALEPRFLSYKNKATNYEHTIWRVRRESGVYTSPQPRA